MTSTPKQRVGRVLDHPPEITEPDEIGDAIAEFVQGSSERLRPILRGAGRPSSGDSPLRVATSRTVPVPRYAASATGSTPKRSPVGRSLLTTVSPTAIAASTSAAPMQEGEVVAAGERRRQRLPAVAQRIRVRGRKRGQHGQAERAADLRGRVDKAGGQAGVVRAWRRTSRGSSAPGRRCPTPAPSRSIAGRTSPDVDAVDRRPGEQRQRRRRSGPARRARCCGRRSA